MSELRERIIQEYWVKKLSDFKTTDLTGGELISSGSRAYQTCIGFIPKKTGDEINSLCKTNEFNKLKFFISAFKLVIHKYTGSCDVVVSTLSPRFDQTPFESLIYLRTLIDSDDSFRNVLNKVHSDITESSSYTDAASLQKYLSDKIHIEADHASHILFTYSPFGNVSDGLNKSSVWLSISEETDGSFKCEVKYNQERYLHNFIEKLISGYIELVTIVVKNIELKVKDVSVLSESDLENVINKFNNHSEFNYPSVTIHELVEAQVRISPHKPAVQTNEIALSYLELNRRANQFGRFLNEKYNISGTTVALYMEKSTDMLVAILAVLKSGASFLNIDTAMPLERIKFILDQSGSQLMLTNKEKINLGDKIKVFDWNKDKVDLSSFPAEDINLNIRTNELAYIIYTSGTTGLPKGVMIEHGNFSVRLLAEKELLNIKSEDVFIQVTNYAFDVSLIEMFVPLISGATVFIPDPLKLNKPNYLPAVMQKYNVSVLCGTPSFIYQLLEEVKVCSYSSGYSLAHLNIGGESLYDDLVQKARSTFSRAQINNFYGPTETSVDATVNLSLTAHNRNIIGKPIPGASVYILDSNSLAPKPINTIGEIFIGGPGVGRGYVANEKLTNEKFLDDPFCNGKMYRTGDFGRWLEDGSIEFKGRIDGQLKIRGNRVEIEEIENCLRTYENVNQAAVLVNKWGNQDVLVAYYTLKKASDPKDIKQYLEKFLSSYMIPQFFMPIDIMPLTSTGKLDRGELSKISFYSGRTIVPPRNPIESKLLVFWKDILKTDEISINDSFFDIGGHSLNALSFINLIQRNFGFSLDLKQFFLHPTIEAIGELIRTGSHGTELEIPLADKKEYYEASYAQRRLWLLDQTENSGAWAYNLPDAYRLRGVLNIKALESALSELINRHEILRTTFCVINGDLKQKIKPHNEYNSTVPLVDLSCEDDKEGKLRMLLDEELTMSFHLGSDFMIRTKLIRLSENDHVLSITMHHIVSDALSMGVVNGELLTLYNSYGVGDVKLTPLRIQYKDYAEWHNRIIDSDAGNSHKMYWMSVLDNYQVLRLTSKRPERKTYNGDSLEQLLDKDAVYALRRLAGEKNASLFMVLLGSINALFYYETKQSDIIIGTPVACRHHKDLENQVGYYLNTLALRTKFTGNDSFVRIIEKVKEVTLNGYRYQDYPFDKLVSELGAGKDRSRNPLFDIGFNFIGIGTLNLPDKVMRGLSVEPIKRNNKSVKTDIWFNVGEREKSLYFAVDYNTDLFDRSYMQHLFEKYRTLLDKLLEMSNVPIDTVIGLTDSVERDKRSRKITALGKKNLGGLKR